MEIRCLFDLILVVWKARMDEICTQVFPNAVLDLLTTKSSLKCNS